MRSFIALLLSLLSLLGGLLVALPRIHPRYWQPQMVATELPWVPVLLGTLAILIQPRRWKSVLSGAAGALLAILPFLRIRRIAAEMDAEMAAGFGPHDEKQLPSQVQRVLRRYHWLPWQMLYITPPQPHAVLHRDIVYRQGVERPLKLDVYQPRIAPLAGDRYPAVIVVHGGAWRKGDKGEYFRAHHYNLASKGYVVFDIQYHLSSEAKWPAQRDDVLAAIDWVREHAEQYRVDPERLALLGRSAGGHLALQAAYCGQHTAVRAVIAMYPPVELRMWHVIPDAPAALLIGQLPHEAPERYTDASVLTHVHPDVPPTLLIQGARDQVVPDSHVELLASHLHTAGVPHAVLRLPWAQHGFDVVINGPGMQLVQYQLERFLAWRLYSREVIDGAR